MGASRPFKRWTNRVSSEDLFSIALFFVQIREIQSSDLRNEYKAIPFRDKCVCQFREPVEFDDSFCL